MADLEDLEEYKIGRTEDLKYIISDMMYDLVSPYISNLGCLDEYSDAAIDGMLDVHFRWILSPFYYMRYFEDIYSIDGYLYDFENAEFNPESVDECCKDIVDTIWSFGDRDEFTQDVRKLTFDLLLRDYEKEYKS